MNKIVKISKLMIQDTYGVCTVTLKIHMKISIDRLVW